MKTIFIAALSLILSMPVWAQKVTLRLTLKKGEVYHQAMEADALIVQNLAGQELKINMVINGKMAYQVMGVQADTYDMDVKYESLTMEMGLPTGTVMFSSDKKDENDIFSTILSLMVGRVFQVQLTQEGKVKSVKGIDQLYQGIFDQFPQIDEAQREQIKAQLMKAYGEESFRGNMEMVSAVFPSAPVSKGDQWNVETQLKSGMSASVKSTYTLSEVKGNACTIKGNSTIESTDKDKYIETNGMSMRLDLKGTMTSSIVIDKQTGWVIEAKIKQSLKGNSHVKPNDQLPEGLSIPMDLTTDLSISGK